MEFYKAMFVYNTDQLDKAAQKVGFPLVVRTLTRAETDLIIEKAPVAQVPLQCGVMCAATNGGRKSSRQYREQQENLKNGECILCRKPLLTKRHCKECAEKVRTLARNRYRKKAGIKLDAPLCGPRRKKRT